LNQSGHKGVPFLARLEEIPSFSKWLEEDVAKAFEGVVVPEDMEVFSLQAKKFKTMYAYGSHFQVKSTEQKSTSTCDFRIAIVFRQPCCFGRWDQNVVDEDLEYVGQIQEIVELDYIRHCIVFLVYEWVKANYRGRNAIVKKDEWGFTVAKFRTLIPYSYESFSFSIHC